MKTLNKVLIGSGLGLIVAGTAGFLYMRRRHSLKRQQEFPTQ